MALTVTRRRGGRSSAARRRWGGGQSRQRAAGGLPDGLTYGLLRYLNPDVDLAGVDRRSGSTIWAAGCVDGRELRWAVAGQRDALSLTAATVCPCRWRTPWISTRAPSTPTPAVPARPLGVGTLSV
ncbi:linear gramicidin synthetase subunit D domain protein [Mycobacterium xenopi 3993]|nr:linear gramicidin synthetase subunit D domain protein [Mycobacterium xenopi 3993]